MLFASSKWWIDRSSSSVKLVKLMCSAQPLYFGSREGFGFGFFGLSFHVVGRRVNDSIRGLGSPYN